MRPSNSSIRSFFVVALTSVIAAHAQVPLNSEVVVSKIEPAFVESPQINAGGYNKKSGVGKPAPWLEVEVTFDRNIIAKAPKFAEELTFNYFVLLKNEGATPDKKPTCLTGSVSHVFVPQEKALHSCIFISPRTLAKLFDGKVPVNVAQAITDAGVTVTGKEGLLSALAWKGTVTKDGKGWWDNPAYAPTAGLMLNKNETPFAPLAWDYYEAIKSKAAN